MVERFGVFDFGLDESQEARARRIHDEAIIVDTLVSGPAGYRVFDEDSEKELRSRVEAGGDLTGVLMAAVEWPVRRALEGRLDEYKRQWDESGITCGNRSIEPFSRESATEHLIGLVQLQFDQFDWLIKARTAGDIRRAKAEGKHASYINTQSVLGPWRDVETLATYHEFGLRMCQLTYNTL